VADTARIEELQAKIAAGQASPPGMPPAGIDPIRWHQARIDGANKQLADLEGVSGPQAAWRRKDLRRRIEHASEAKQRADADSVDRRPARARRRERRRRVAVERGSVVVNVSDPQSRLMREGSTGGTIQGYNAQLAVSDDHLIIGIYLSQDATDFHCFVPTLAAATAQVVALDKQIGLVLADAGYLSEENITAEGPERLIAAGKSRQIAAQARENPTSGPPPPGASPIEAMRHRMRDPVNADRYKRRSATVETVIAHLKDLTALRRFAHRGIQAASGELHLAATVVNLSRLHQRGTPATT